MIVFSVDSALSGVWGPNEECMNFNCDWLILGFVDTPRRVWNPRWFFPVKVLVFVREIDNRGMCS